MTREYSAKALHVTMVTPFDRATGEVVLDELAAGAARLAATPAPLPVTPIINAEAGEIYTLTRDERRRNVKAAVEAVGGAPLVAGVVGRSSGEAIEMARDAVADGAAALFVLPPYGSLDVTHTWNPVRYPEVVVDYVRRIADAVGPVPLVIHPTAPRSPEYGIGWPVETVAAVVDAVPSVAGWKMTYSYEGFRRVARFLRAQAPHVAVLPSSAVRYQENLANDQFDGACSGSFCYALEPMVEHIGFWRQGQVEEATKLWKGGLCALHEFVYSDYSRLHIRYKVAAWVAGTVSSPFMRDPIPAPSLQEARDAHELLAAIGLAVLTEDEISAGLT